MPLPLPTSMREIRAKAYMKAREEAKQTPVSILIQTITLLTIGILIGTILAVQI